MLRLKAHAKINWSLDILGSRGDGYHRMDMLMESVTLHDSLTIFPAETLSLSMVGGNALPSDNNLVLRAARALQAATGTDSGAAITLTKRIPVGAGMGGGSADAAAAFVGLNTLWGTGLTIPALQEIALPLGADIPFMLVGGLARVGGIGEQLRWLPIPAQTHLVVVQPCQALSTKAVFQAYDRLGDVRHPDTESAQRAVQARDYPLLNASGGNVLLQASQQARPQIGEALAALEAFGAAYAQMTGSGSAVFGAFCSATQASAACRVLKKRWNRCWLAQTAALGIEPDGV